MAYKFVIDIACNANSCLSFNDDGWGKSFDQGNADQEVANIVEQIVKDIDAGKFRADRFPHNFVSYKDSEGKVIGTARYEPFDEEA